MADGDVIDYLVAHGAYVEAARIAADRGELRRAVQLYERVWRFADALPLALAAGDAGLAVRLALDAGLAERAVEIADATLSPADLSAVADAFAGRGRVFEAARAAERAGDWRRAVGLYRRSGAPLEEARLLARAGEVREAGLIYERLVRDDSAGRDPTAPAPAGQAASDPAPASEGAMARLELGRLLEGLGRHEDAARHLQAAARIPALRPAAWRALCGPLVALGFRDAALELAERLRQLDGTTPSTPEEIAAREEEEAAIARSSLPASHAAAAPATAISGPATPETAVVRRFQVKRLLGSGATGRVFEAIDTLLGTPVALKLLSVGGGAATNPTADNAEREAYLRFAREADAAGRLRHPNIVALHDAQPASGLFVFELMSGGTLAERLAAEGPLNVGLGRRLALDLLAALGAAHERGITHRDVKPANIFFDAAGNAKLGDFGAAHLADFGQTQTGGFLGTLAYMSPEQITGATIGFAADLYALAATLYEALVGRPPFLGPDLVTQHLSEAPPTPSGQRTQLTVAHDQVLLRALAKAPADRYGSAAEMAEAITGWPVASEATATAGSEDAGRGSSGGGADANAGALSAPEDAAAELAEEVWRADGARVVRRRDPRTGREVLVEERSIALEGEALEYVRRLAAAGGPFVQRVLRLGEARTEVWYEAIPGDRLPVTALTEGERALLSASLAELPAEAAQFFVRTPGGPVLLVLSPPNF